MRTKLLLLAAYMYATLFASLILLHLGKTDLARPDWRAGLGAVELAGGVAFAVICALTFGAALTAAKEA